VKALLAGLRRVFVGLAALCVLVLGALLVVEESGLVVRLADRVLQQRLGPLGQRITIQHIELSWFEPGFDVQGIALTPDRPAGVSDCELRSVHVRLTPRFDGIQSIRIEGGRLLLGQRLFDFWNELANARKAEESSGHAWQVPPCSVDGLRIDLELYDDSPFELGSLDLRARPTAEGGVELAGLLAPSLGGALTAPEPIRVNGALSPEDVRLWASARAIALESNALPDPALKRSLESLTVQEGAARLTLDSAFEMVFADSARPRGHVRASLVDGHFVLGAGRPPVEELALELDATLEPPEGADLWTRDAWNGRATLAARLGTAPIQVRAELGRAAPGDDWLLAWGSVRDFHVEREFLEALGIESRALFLREMLDPRGSLDLAGTASIGRSGDTWTHDVAVHTRARGTLGLRYLGYPGDPASGFALPLSEGRGEIVLGDRSSGLHPWRVCGLELAARHPSGLVNGWLQVTAPRRGPVDFLLPELDLALSTPSLAVDEALLRMLGDNRYLSWIVPDFSPLNGTVGGDFRLRTGPELHGTSGCGSLRLHGLSLRWAEVPVPMENIDGALELRWGTAVSEVLGHPDEKHRPIGVSYWFDNRAGPRTGAQARVEGWLRENDLPPVVDPTLPPPPHLQEVRIDIDELGLRGRDFDVLAKRFPQLEREVRDYGAVGRMHVRFRGTQVHPAIPFRSDTEATPIEVHVRPQFFQRQTRDLRGRVLIQAEEGPDGSPESETHAAQLVLAGTWPNGVELATHGTIPAVGTAVVNVYGAGIDPTNTSFKGALSTTLAQQATTGIDLSSWTLSGRVDLDLETTFDPASEDPAENQYRVHLRDNGLQGEDLRLRNLRGTLEQRGDVLASPLVEATLGGHPLELRNVRTFPLAVLASVPEADPWLSREGFWKDALGRALQADVTTRDLPLDADHLEGLLEPEALEALRAETTWRGQMDVLGARLVVTSEASDQGKVAFRGRLRPHDLALRLGLPIRIDSADLDLEELILESERFRGWGRITALDARIAERELTAASMIVGYVDGRLTVDNLSGDFEGGRLESLGGVQGGARKALGIDLAEPHRFDVALRMTDANVGSLLRGVFQSSIADEGVLNASLQISGTPGDVLALTGRGTVSLDEGALWSIPVMRALFAQLGFDKSGLFDRLRSRFELRDGRIQVSHLEIQSSLLDLVGEGWQDLDGQLSYDMEVRYGLLDRLGPFGRMLYWLNNNLMRVAVRGDFERPEVKIRNSILELITGFEDDPRRLLPLPGFSTLGTRF